MQVITDATELLRQLGAYAYNPSTDPELADKLQTMPGNAVDHIFLAMELLNTFRDRLGATGLLLLGQLAKFSKIQQWEVPGQIGRIDGFYKGALRDLGEPGDHPLVEDDPDPIMVYRADGISWKTSFVPDLGALRASKRKAINDLKVTYENAGAPTPFGVANSDADSRGKVNGLVTFAMLAKSMDMPFEQGFTLADDSTVVVDANMMIALGMAVGSHVAAVHARSRVLKGLIEAAETVEDIKAIDLDSGWPGQEEPAEEVPAE